MVADLSPAPMSAGDGPDDGPQLRIGELARRVGTAPSTLRAWERRYGVLDPARGESGYRLYSPADERRLKLMLGLISEGLAPAEAARRAKASHVREGQPDAIDPAIAASLHQALRDQLLAYRAEDAERTLDRAMTVLSVDSFLTDLILPVLREIGDRFEREEATIGQEHFASNVIRGRLLGLARGWGGGEGRLALLACPGGEQHDLGLIAFGLTLRNRGWRVAFLGADTPVEAVHAAAERMSPDVMILCAMEGRWFERGENAYRGLAELAPLFLAGSGVSGELADRLGARHLDQGPVEAAAMLAG